MTLPGAHKKRIAAVAAITALGMLGLAAAGVSTHCWGEIDPMPDYCCPYPKPRAPNMQERNGTTGHAEFRGWQCRQREWSAIIKDYF